MPTIHYFVHHRRGRSPGQRFRCEQYEAFLRNAGFDSRWNNLLDEKEDALFYSPRKYLGKTRLLLRKRRERNKQIRQIASGDIAFVYREAFVFGSTRMERRMKAHGARLVFDFDDAIWMRDVSEGNRALSFLKRPAKTADICRLSDVVIVGNDHLARYARQFSDSVVVIPTTVDTDYHKPIQVTRIDDRVCIGWTGSETTVRHFEAHVPVLQKLKQKFADRIRFKVITNKPVRFPELGVEATLWNRADEVLQLADIDIGIMPLPDDEWSRGKCGFKLLQYMAMEKACVASPVGVNTDIITEGEHGLLAASDDEWIDKLSLLIADAEMRTRLGEAGRRRVIEAYSVDTWRERYVHIFKTI